MTEKPDPFDDLFVDQTFDPNLLASIIRPFVRLHAETAKVIFTDEAKSLTVKDKLLVYLLARKVLKHKNIIQDETAKPGEIEEKTGLKGGSIRPQLKALKDEDLVDVTEESGYFVQDYKISEISSILRRN